MVANRYAYVNGDPINYSDPTGHRLCAGDRIRESAAERQIGDAHLAKPRPHQQVREALSSVLLSVPDANDPDMMWEFNLFQLYKGDSLGPCGSDSGVNGTDFRCSSAFWGVFDQVFPGTRSAGGGFGNPERPSAQVASGHSMAETATPFVPGVSCIPLIVGEGSVKQCAIDLAIDAAVTLGVGVGAKGVSVAIRGGLRRGAGGVNDAASVLSRTAQEQSVQGVESLQRFLSPAERAAFMADPARGSRFLGQAVHRATRDALDEAFPGRFIYRTQGIDFVDTWTGEMIELTTTGQVAAHAARPGYRGASYALYGLPG